MHLYPSGSDKWETERCTYILYSETSSAFLSPFYLLYVSKILIFSYILYLFTIFLTVWLRPLLYISFHYQVFLIHLLLHSISLPFTYHSLTSGVYYQIKRLLVRYTGVNLLGNASIKSSSFPGLEVVGLGRDYRGIIIIHRIPTSYEV